MVSPRVEGETASQRTYGCLGFMCKGCVERTLSIDDEVELSAEALAVLRKVFNELLPAGGRG